VRFPLRPASSASGADGQVHLVAVSEMHERSDSWGNPSAGESIVPDICRPASGARRNRAGALALA